MEERRRRPPRRRGLSSRDRVVIDIEREWGPSAGVLPYKLEVAQRELGLTPSGYALVVNGLLNDPEAHAHAPAVIDALRAVRESRALPDDPPAVEPPATPDRPKRRRSA